MTELPGEKLIIKLWDSLVDKGIGNLLKPWQQRREGRTTIDLRREEMLAIAQAEQDVEAIRRGQKVLAPNGELVALPAPIDLSVQVLDAPCTTVAIEYISDVASRNSRVEDIRREISVAKAVLHAEQELQSDPTPPKDEPVSDDWLLRWRDCAAGVSTEELQSLWGKVLAGEVKSPGHYSLRTMEFLRNLSQGEARAIERISPFVVSGIIFLEPLISEFGLLTGEGLEFNDLHAMEEIGLLAGVGVRGKIIWNCVGSTSFEKVLKCHGKLLQVTSPDPNKVFGLIACTVTAIGWQVLQLGNFQPNEKMLLAMGRAIKAQGFKVEMGRYVHLDGSKIERYDLTPI